MRDLKVLVSDTLLFLKQEGWLSDKPISVPPMQNVVSVPKQKKMEPQAVSKEKRQPDFEKKSPPLPFAHIKKHLPHLVLIEKIPAPLHVAIIVSEESDVPFFKKLAKAIEDYFCPTTLLRKGEKIGSDSFSLVLTPEKIEQISEKKQILLANREVYENNTQEKKNLWSQICLHLSPKSS